jgi:hypothetical protein
MADKAAGPGSSGDKPSPGSKPGSPDRATAGQAKSRDGAGKQNKATSADEVQPEFREALERKRAREAGTVGAPRGKDAGKIHRPHGPAGNRRSFRRKSG